MRQIKWIICLLSMSLLLSACNLGGPAQPEEEIPAEDLDTASQPTVTILSPSDGSDFVVDEEIPVSVSATDAIGVTRVQLFANGSLVRTVSSEFSEGEVSYEGVLNFTPRSEGEFTLRVIAFRDSISSPPVQITVNVGDDAVTVTQRSDDNTGNGSNDGNNAPVIPNDGVCRALTLVGLNFRAQPTTTRDNVITTFAQNTLLTIVGRLGD
ncbi:MAG: Ig-like domain-containing protein, partial [Chloroflexota bacterium]